MSVVQRILKIKTATLKIATNMNEKKKAIKYAKKGNKSLRYDTETGFL